MERGRDSLFRHSQPLILLASWLFHHAPRGSMSSCNSLHFSLRNSVFFFAENKVVEAMFSVLIGQYGTREIGGDSIIEFESDTRYILSYLFVALD